MAEKKPFSQIMNKVIVTKEGKRLGKVKDITFETRTGELLQLVLSEPSAYVGQLGLEINSQKEAMIPFSTVIALGDFVVVSEEDLA